jgi:hypothetical protein
VWIKSEVGALINIGMCVSIFVERSKARNLNGELVDLGGVISSYGSGGVKCLITTYNKEAEAVKIIERIEKALKAGETLLDLSK